MRILSYNSQILTNFQVGELVEKRVCYVPPTERLYFELELAPAHIIERSLDIPYEARGGVQASIKNL